MTCITARELTQWPSAPARPKPQPVPARPVVVSIDAHKAALAVLDLFILSDRLACAIHRKYTTLKWKRDNPERCRHSERLSRRKLRNSKKSCQAFSFANEINSGITISR